MLRKHHYSVCSTDRVFWKSWKCSRKIPLSVSCFSNVNLWLYQNRTPPWIFFEECSYLFHDLYLLSEPRNNHCFERAAQGQLSKCKRRNKYNFLIKSSWLTQNEKELNNVGDTELRLQKQWKSKTSNMLQVSRNVIITSRTWGPGAWDRGPEDK